ncbi:MAG: glycosyltransferase family 4 protein [Chloroflexi bacterium]|nr:glycosyltransferase family 4 protein [Chloroflexota bacterium]
MKIALLSEKYTPDLGGLAISTGRLGHLLCSAGHELRVFAPTSNLPPSEQRTLPSKGVRVTRFGAHKRVDDTLVDWFELIVDEHRREPFDLLHAYFLSQAGFVAAYAGKYLNLPSVVSIRGNDIERAAFDPSRFSHVMYALQNAGAVTTNAAELAKKAAAFLDRKIHLIPNGIDTALFKPMQPNEVLAESILAQHNRKIIGFAGELRKKKGLQTLLNAYAQVHALHPCTLLIAGEVRPGGDQQTFEEFKASIPDADIIVTGAISHQDMPSYYALMDVFVHPSERDGMPNALLEAMACEKAVVCTPVGGALDVIRDGANGIFAPVNDAGAFAQAILGLLNRPQKREAISRSARETVISSYTLEKELQANLAVYRHLRGNQEYGLSNRT